MHLTEEESEALEPRPRADESGIRTQGNSVTLPHHHDHAGSLFCFPLGTFLCGDNYVSVDVQH